MDDQTNNNTGMNINDLSGIPPVGNDYNSLQPVANASSDDLNSTPTPPPVQTPNTLDDTSQPVFMDMNANSMPTNDFNPPPVPTADTSVNSSQPVFMDMNTPVDSNEEVDLNSVPGVTDLPMPTEQPTQPVEVNPMPEAVVTPLESNIVTPTSPVVETTSMEEVSSTPTAEETSMMESVSPTPIAQMPQNLSQPLPSVAPVADVLPTAESTDIVNTLETKEPEGKGGSIVVIVLIVIIVALLATIDFLLLRYFFRNTI